MAYVYCPYVWPVRILGTCIPAVIYLSSYVQRTTFSLLAVIGEPLAFNQRM